MVGRRRETRGRNEPVEVDAGNGLGEERPDRPPRLDERGDAAHQRNRSSPVGRTSSRAELSRNHASSRPRTITAGTAAPLPLPTSAAPPPSSAPPAPVTSTPPPPPPPSP